MVCNAAQLGRFRGVVLVGSARQSFDPPEKPEQAPTVVLVGDPKDSNFKDPGPAAEKALAAKGYEVIVLEHNAGHSMPPAELKEVFAWIDAVVSGKKTTLATRRLDDGRGGKVTWAIEGRTPGQLVRAGWSKSTLKPGDTITVDFSPAKDGSLTGLLTRVRRPDGTVVGDPAPPAQ